MSRYAHSLLLQNGPAYLAANANKFILTDSYTASYATANGSAKVAECALVSGDFAIVSPDGSACVLTAALAGKAAGNALKAVADGSNMHGVFVDTVNSRVLMVTEESSNAAITLGNPVVLSVSPTYSVGQPTA